MDIRCVFKPSDTLEYYASVLEHKINGIEVLFWEPYLSAPEFASFQRKIHQLTNQYQCGLSVHAPHIDVNYSSPNRYSRELATDLLMRSAEWAMTLNADVLVIHPGLGVNGMSQGDWHRGYPSPEGWEQKSLPLVARIIEACGKSFPNLKLAVENMIFPHEFFRTPADLKNLLQAINASNVGVCLDVGHATAAQQDWEEFFQTLGNSIFHLHLHDNNGSVDEHLPVGAGSINYEGFIQKIETYGFSGAITLEYKVEQNPFLVLNNSALSGTVKNGIIIW